jgi:sirohydrochlorin ferrochelatase
MTNDSAHVSKPANRSLPAGCGVLLVGHGSREPNGTEEFLQTAALVQRVCGPTPVEPCFLEFAAPTIEAGFRNLMQRGVRQVVVVPALLFAAGHAKRDIPHEVARVAAEYPQVQVRQTSHLGTHEKLLELSRQRFLEALGGDAGEGVASRGSSRLVLVGRGSHDDQATAEMHEYARMLAGRLTSQDDRTPDVAVGFVAMAQPGLEEVLSQAAASQAHTIVVQPHLLFRGVLTDRIAATVRTFATRFPRQNWIATGPLGPVPLLAEALADRAAEGWHGLH